MNDDSYYHAFVGRIRGFNNASFATTEPVTRFQAFEQYHAHLKDQYSSDYNPRDVVIDHVFYSTDYIDQ